MLILARIFEFSAAHRLFRPEWSLQKNIEVFGKCAYENGHGHNYKMEVRVAGEINPQTGMVIDASELEALVEEVILTDLDHKNLDKDVEWLKGKISTVENLIEAVWDRLEIALAQLPYKLCLQELILSETSKIYAIKRREGKY